MLWTIQHTQSLEQLDIRFLGKCSEFRHRQMIGWRDVM